MKINLYSLEAPALPLSCKSEKDKQYTALHIMAYMNQACWIRCALTDRFDKFSNWIGFSEDVVVSNQIEMKTDRIG